MAALRRAPAALVLALPFLIGAAALRGLTATLPIFHTGDELNYHLPTIRQFAAQLPTPHLGHYIAAQTPLFHLLMAVVAKVAGFQLWRLRLVEVLISYGLALAVHRLLRRRLALDDPAATSLALLFALSPYVLGTSFRLLTDNLALLFSVLALERFEAWRTGAAGLGGFAAGAAAVGAAILTRQSAAFLLAVGGLYAVGGRQELGWGARGGLLGLLALAAAPAAALFATWHGIVPPGGDPSSCGLCAAGHAAGASAGGLVAATPELALATVGLYGAVLFAPQALFAVRGGGAGGGRRRWRLRGPAVAAATGALLLLAFPARPGGHAAGLLWNAARRFPAVLGSSLIFWALVPLAGAVLAVRLRTARSAWPAATLLVAFLVGALAIRYPWQKYVDPFALLALLLTVRPGELSTPRSLAGAGVLAAGFLAYLLSFV